MHTGWRRTAALIAAGLAVAVGCSGSAGSAAASALPEPRPGPLPACTVRAGADLALGTGALFGVNLDWAHQSLADYAASLGRRPAVAVSFSHLPLSDSNLRDLTAAGAQVRGNGGLLLLTLEPAAGLAAVTPAAIADLVSLLRTVNATGVPVLVRLGHEMNGSWYAWGQQPRAYVAAFRAVAAAVHTGAPGSAMMWAPNYAGGYPFTGGRYAAAPGTPDSALLDTDGDGVVTAGDDPYAPYYPGDDAVDWVGLSLYHWGSAHPWGENEVPEAGKFAAQLTGTYDGAGGDDTAAPDFYGVYGDGHGKPVAIPETAALVVPGPDVPAATELAIKQAWWRQVFAGTTAQRFPRLRMVNWFEWEKAEPEVSATVPWGVTGRAVTREPFRADLPSWLVFADRPVACEPDAEAAGRRAHAPAPRVG